MISEVFYSEICPAQALAFTVGYLFFVSYVVSKVYFQFQGKYLSKPMESACGFHNNTASLCMEKP